MLLAHNQLWCIEERYGTSHGAHWSPAIYQKEEHHDFSGV